MKAVGVWCFFFLHHHHVSQLDSICNTARISWIVRQEKKQLEAQLSEERSEMGCFVVFKNTCTRYQEEARTVASDTLVAMVTWRRLGDALHLNSNNETRTPAMSDER